MKRHISERVLLVATCFLAGALAWGQKNSGSAQNRIGTLEVAVVYNPMMTNLVGGSKFWMQGGSVQVHGQFWRGFGIVADVSGLHAENINGAGTGLDLVTATFGPRYTWYPPRQRFSVYGQALAGTANAMNSLFPTSTGAETSASGYAVKVGGGANVPLSHQFSLRAIEADWMRTDFPNSTTVVQNSLRLGAGVVYRFR